VTKRRRPGFSCAVCGCGMEAGIMWLLLAPGTLRGIRWPQRARAFRRCPECGHPLTAQVTSRDVLEVA
jgi:hypothetical protein